MAQTLDLDLASLFTKIALGHVTRAYPNKLDHVLTGDEDAIGVRALHPIFYGSFDWHSCVHGYWMLVRLYRLFPGLEQTQEVGRLFDEHLTPGKVQGELAYLHRPSSAGFERPYGWAWLLMLAGELMRLDRTSAWSRAMTPLAEAFVDRFRNFLPKADYPVRTGVHSSTAFALRLALDYSQTAGDEELQRLVTRKALQWYGADAAAQAWEPSGDDFLSPTLMEAELMRAVLGPTAFPDWFAAFLPQAAEGEPKSLFTPVRVADRSDGKIAHLDGLNLSRAWCLRAIAAGLGEAHPARRMMTAAADAHLEASLPHVAGDYMGEHWLASFAVLGLSGL